MRDTPSFPLLPVDQRFLARMERYRNYVPPPAAPVPFDAPVESSAAATRTLRRYMRHPSRMIESPVRPVPTGPSVLERLPGPAINPTSTAVAATLLAAELLYFLTCRPDLRGRALRRKLLTPLDVRRALVVTRTGLAAARVLGKTFARRTGWDGGWIA